ncbi:MAG: alpha/beta hydrolase [Lachnospiraceae bacterium]|nr:alpha/beta hydrolase [Lachnospiraceae bacterium]
MRSNICQKHLLNIADKKIEVYASPEYDNPVIYLNTFAGEGEKVYQALCNTDCPDFTLVAIGGLTWDHDMAPWDIPPISKNDTPCTGGADKYLQLLTDEIVPEVESLMRGRVLWRGLAGYSLAGLFALYSLYHADIFSRVASMSGSLWFPDFKEYVFSNKMKKEPEHLYLSLGSRECKTTNPYLRTVRKNTEEIYAFYKQQGIDTQFQLNPGNHYQDAAQRTAQGIQWILKK